MKEIGIDISGQRSKHVDEFAGPHFDYVLTMCDKAKESCPVFSVATKQVYETSRSRLRLKRLRGSG